MFFETRPEMHALGADLRSSNRVERGTMDEKLSGLFQEWLSALQAIQPPSSDSAARGGLFNELTGIESRIAETPAEGVHGLVIKLGLHCFLNEHADAASVQSESAYRDLVRLAGRDPAADIAALIEMQAA
jgi:hypothetical protein